MDIPLVKKSNGRPSLIIMMITFVKIANVTNPSVEQ